MSNPLGRFEFRVWGNHLGPFRDRLNAIAAPSDPRESAETYILSRATDAANVKIRAGLLDIKLMFEQVGRLERWRPVLKSEFPLDSRTIVEQVFPTLGVAIPHISQPSYTHGEFIRDLVQPHRDLAMVDVVKLRTAVHLRKVHGRICRSSNRRRRDVRNGRDRIRRSGRRAARDRKTWPELSREYKLCSSSEADDWDDAARERLGRLNAQRSTAFNCAQAVSAEELKKMAKEIERQFLVQPRKWSDLGDGLAIRQGYLSASKQCSVRVRTYGDQAYVTMKGADHGHHARRIRVRDSARRRERDPGQLVRASADRKDPLPDCVQGPHLGGR